MTEYEPPLPPSPSAHFEQNLGRMLETAVAPAKIEPVGAASFEFEERMKRAMLGEVRRVRRQRRRRTAFWAAALAAATLMLAVSYWHWVPSAPPGAARLRSLYGLVSVKDNGRSVELSQVGPPSRERWTTVRNKAWIDTRWGSQAEILLGDNSRLLTRPQTLFQLERGRQGEKVVLKAGWMSVTASKQAPGKKLTIDTPGAEVSVLGTQFDVHVVQKADGIKQTRVSVAGGQVELESAGRKILLPPNTEGIADAASPPRRRSQTPEINELVRLMDLNRKLATDAGAKPGLPSIIEFQGDGSASVWLVVPLNNPGGSNQSGNLLKLKEAAAGVEAYSWAGSPLGTKLSGRRIEVQLAGAPAEIAQDGRVILKLGGVRGLFTGEGRGTFEFIRLGDDPAVLSLFQFMLPESAQIEELRPRPIEQTRSLTRQSITLAARARPLELIE